MSIQKNEFDGQFVLSKTVNFFPNKWQTRHIGDWALATHKSLPVTEIFDANGQATGWLLGYPITAQAELLKSSVRLDRKLLTHDDFESWLCSLSGRFACIYLSSGAKRVYLDSCGSLAVVYSTDHNSVASTNTLLADINNDGDHELIRLLGMPDSDSWYPSGLTPMKNVRRLLPNHYLDLERWLCVRHWPKPSDLQKSTDFGSTVQTVVKCLKKNIGAVSRQYPVQMSLTAGRDSRMLLACSREYLHRIKFHTGVWVPSGVDSEIGRQLARKLKLNHVTLRVKLAGKSELDDWQSRTGHCVSGEIWRIHPTSRKIDPQRAFLPGCAGEVGRAYYWREGDETLERITAHDILKRTKLPATGKILENTELWLGEISNLGWNVILDLTYIEQRLGCWAGPLQYGQDGMHRARLFPFNDREIFKAILNAPVDPRRSQMLADDILASEWPELLDLPFNKLTGAAGLIQAGRNMIYSVASDRMKDFCDQLYAWKFQAC
jgi:hypothetical protein